MKELKINKDIADEITKFLHPNQIKHLQMHKSEYTKFLTYEDDQVKISVKSYSEEKQNWETMYEVTSPELQNLKGKFEDI